MNEQAADESVTHWFLQLKAGNQSFLTKLLGFFLEKVKTKARREFGNSSRSVCDEDDIAVQVFGDLATQAKKIDVTDREGLLRLLLLVTQRKVASERRRQSAKSRGNGKVILETDLGRLLKDCSHQSVNKGSQYNLALIEQELTALMEILPDDQYREIVKLSIAGHDKDEIAEILGVVPRTVYRKLRYTQELWMKSKQLD